MHSMNVESVGACGLKEPIVCRLCATADCREGAAPGHISVEKGCRVVLPSARSLAQSPASLESLSLRVQELVQYSRNYGRMNVVFLLPHACAASAYNHPPQNRR